MKRKTTEEIIALAKEKHGDYYDYSKTVYVNKRTKITVTCPIHGDFTIYPYDHIKGGGCQKCGKETSASKRSKLQYDFIKEASALHNGKYDYSLVDYKGSDKKVIIFCPIHGEFKQKPKHHLSGSGCPKCGIEERSQKRRLAHKTILQRSNEMHQNKYRYLPLENSNVQDKMEIICPIHGAFTQRIEDHIRGCGCQLCANQKSKDEDEICALLGDVEYERHNRNILSGKEIDIYIPSLKLGIEYNGLRWHTDFAFGRDRNYHIGKMNECNKNGISLVQIFEDEWINHKEIVKNKIKHILGIDNDKARVFARKCNVNVISKNYAQKFLNKNHIQGFSSASIYLGLFYNNALIAAMSFLEEKKGMWNLNRFATDIRYNCVGAGGKLFKYFTTHYTFKEIKSFADRRWTTNVSNNIYTKLGFSFDKFTKADYTYYNPKVEKYKRFHKFGFRKQLLHRKYGLPLTMTETEMIKELGYDRIWDCGLIKYIYYNHNL